MMEIENFWKGFKPSPKQLRGINYFGYGCIPKRRTRSQTPGLKALKKRCFKEIKKYGFDLSETWNLDSTIIEFMSDNFGGIWRLCGNKWEWDCYDLEGNKHDLYKEFKTNPDIYKESRKWNITRCDSIKKHLQDFLDNDSEENKQKLRDFCIPRLRVLSKYTNGWPSGENFPKFEDWINELNNMADMFEQKTYSPYFISYFFALWD